MDVTPLAWTPEHVARFWDYWTERPDRHSTYFAYQVGTGVCNFLQHVRGLAGLRVLDYGAGPGFLTEQLLRKGAYAAAVEYSPASVRELNRRFQRERCWLGAKSFRDGVLPWPDDHFDLVCCLETIEHVLSEDLNRVLNEMKRVVRPGGHVLLTTPNSEDLRAQTVFCPHCCHEFHRWQHVRRWTPESLQRRLAKSGFDVSFCRGLSFHDFQRHSVSVRRIGSLRFWRNAIADGTARFHDWLSGAQFPDSHRLHRYLSRADQHLVAVAGKRRIEIETAKQSSERAA